MTETHNGYPNYETWIVASFWDNNQEDYFEIKDTARRVLKESEYPISDLSTELKQKLVIDSYTNVTNNSVFSTLINAAISRVNFAFIANAILEEVD